MRPRTEPTAIDREEVERLLQEWWATGRSDVLVDLARALGHGDGEEDIGALQWLLWDLYEDWQTNDPEDLDFETSIAYQCDVLAERTQLYACDCPVSTESQFPVDTELDPECQMRLAQTGEGVQLTVKIKAVHWSEAAARAEKLVAQVLGAAVALGLCDRLSARELADEPAVNVHLGPPGWRMSYRLPYHLSRWIASARFQLPADATEIEGARAGREGSAGLLETRLRALRRLFSSASESAAVSRHASGLYFRAHQTNATEFGADRGEVLHRAVMCLEALLLDPSDHSDVRARLAEAVAQRLGVSVEHRKSLRRSMKTAFDVRSRYAHTGNPEPDWALVHETLSVAKALLRRELEALADP